jgi:cytochrome c peroxidase
MAASSQVLLGAGAAGMALGTALGKAYTQIATAADYSLRIAPLRLELAPGKVIDAAKRGFTLFTGKALCFACHTGWRFTDDKFHDIGTTTVDEGRGRVIKDETLNFAFKTPTLRSVTLRAPYMHNGSIATLNGVMRHYEKGGIERPSRSPMMLAIQLSDQERADLVSFMETLTGSIQTMRGNH